MTRITNQQMLANLEAAGIDADRSKFPKEVKRHNKNEESAMQSALIRWWADVCGVYNLPVFSLMAIPMGGIRNVVTAAIMKREGARRGSLDLLLTVPRRQHHGLWIEMKTKSGRISQEQAEMVAHLIAQGYSVYVCRSIKEAQRLIFNYLS